MNIDEVVWQIINRQQCSFKVKTDTRNFCRNEYNLTGLCNRQACPLANSQYATIKHEKGICYLYIKTAERAHTPANQWEKIQLSKNYDKVKIFKIYIKQQIMYKKALLEIDEHLPYWSNFIIHKCKQRLTKLRQMLIRIRKMKINGFKELVPIKKKAERRDKIREQKALIAANLEEQIEKELIERLKDGVYEDIYNFNKNAFKKVMDDQEIYEQEEEGEEKDEASEENISDAEFVYDPNQQYSDDDNLDQQSEDNEQEQSQQSIEEEQKKKINKKSNNKQKKNSRKVRIEYEQEEEFQQQKKEQITHDF
ncbi:maintenance of killer 16 protein, putative [Ichthyophthirius multifiliis]|uniref:Protein MAK16 homolog n=1 Tax=Ichthyophthirius multifiliis TaxID=5932 RepID=G0R6A4_ICHMU|nr:maintenance of killer 16 protein, putative [Ichthyophthirius multifiliis]EGR27001.1 maintenance of killer 16 protein, putative [Ichthyophthirius multifiliis]|eukprot:XP_004023885.1 maintenance of killer 16 protein, putative [Ichthyophthirius multifiliis]